MKNYMEYVDEYATLLEQDVQAREPGNGGSVREFNVCRTRFVTDAILEKVEIPEHQQGALKNAIYLALVDGDIPANASAQRQALERFRNGESTVSKTSIPADL